MEIPQYKVYLRIHPKKQSVKQIIYNKKVSRYPNKVKGPTTISESRTQKLCY